MSSNNQVLSGSHPGEAGRLAMWFLIGSEIVIFGAAVVSYLLLRLNRPEWVVDMARLNANAGMLNTLVLLTSSFSMALAHAAAEDRDQAKVAKRLGLTLLLAAIFLCVKGWEYSAKFHHGIFPSTNVFWSFYFLMTGLHALHVVIGMIAITVLWVRASRGTLAPNLNRVELTGLYWHLVDIVWIFLFPMLYLS